ncbi:MAG: TAXI family TRAP transporter solute-binding subunit [Planctomycetes bacterium]|nr:TAXI family TRAP transporter solute-binding subunit [Planctomycetota bacterium]
MTKTGNLESDAERDGRADLWKIWGGVTLIVALGLLAAWQFVGEPPPRRLVMATGVENGGYDRGGQALRDALAADGIEVELRRTAGSLENLELLRRREVDVAFVQGGTVGDRTEGLVGVASLYHEPLWIFVRDDAQFELVPDLRGKRLQIGPRGSGTRAMVLELLEANAVVTDGAELGDLPIDDAIAELRDGRCDALCTVTSPDSPRIAALFAMPAIRLLPLRRSVAYSRRFRFLAPLVLTEGMIDLQADLPRQDVPLVSPTAGLLARDDLHPALIPVLYEAARRHYRAGGLFEAEGEFPNLRRLDVPPADAAVRYERDGPSFLYRTLPFQLAAALDRLKVMLLPLLTLLIPLFRIAPPIYRWRIRSKIFRWYRVLLRLEQRVRLDPSPQNFDRAVRELDRVGDEIGAVRVPLGYAEELYNVRMHIRLVRRDLDARRASAAS